MTVIVDSPEFAELIDPAATMTEIGSGYQFSEGPAWDVARPGARVQRHPGRCPLALDPGHRDGARRLADAQGQRPGLRPRRQPAWCASRPRAPCRGSVATASTRLIAFHHDGITLNSPNDLVVRASDGSIYFTDPDYGRWNDWIGCKREFVREAKGVYRIPPGGGDVELVSDPAEFEQPNGLCFSPDESLLYVNDSPAARSRCTTSPPTDRWGTAGCCSGRSVAGVMAEGNVDGMECDALGNVWTSGPGGVWVIAPDGTADRPHRDARDLRQRGVGRRRPAHALPDDVEDRADDADLVAGATLPRRPEGHLVTLVLDIENVVTDPWAYDGFDSGVVTAEEP